ncbi:NHL repeat-containing protein [Fibrella aestuarina BUZ 2]|uniref:NHL repeat-containing protein n=1 Tax=Fibrella aestuarina BUZ 2 TaxID=1166018 RepID=I0KF38_9BACT|nr:NHL repeat-containing protein [Fibrella aestuarina]CCH02741.1 NHL repeat-containing protein [Fibrella aestuarina BUZ 2]
MNLSVTPLLFLAAALVTLACTKPTTEVVTPGTTTGKTPYVTITTIAGADTQKGFINGKGKAAKFKYPWQLTIDKNDNLYVIDQRISYYGGSVIRKVDPAGNVTTFAQGLASVTDLCVDPRDGVTLYAIESGDAPGVPNGIFRINSAGQVTRLSGGPDPDGGYSFGYRDGPLARAKFSNPWSIIMDKAGMLYIGDGLNHCIRKVDLSTNTVSTFAGKPLENTAVCKYADGKGPAAQVCTVEDLTLDQDGNLFIPDWGNNSVRMVTPDGSMSTYLKLSTGYTPDRPRSQSGVYQPYRVQYDPVNKRLIVVVDTGSGLIMVTPDDYVHSLGRVLSSDYADTSPGTTHGTYSLAVNSKGELFTLDTYNHCIRKRVISWQ